MGYDFNPRNKDAGDFHLGAFSWPFLLEQCGYYFQSLHKGGRYFLCSDDPRDEGATYPGIIANDGYRITAEEARVLARIARNYAKITAALPEENAKDVPVSTPDYLKPWPAKTRDDWNDRFLAFADWAEKSGGFAIW